MGEALSWSPDSSQRLSLEQHQKLAARANSLGEYLIACDIVDQGLKQWAGDRRLTQIRALALARMGSNREARAILAGLQSDEHTDEETLGILARTYKDLWLKSREAKDLEQAYQAYASAYRNSPERYWTGINAATLAFAKGDRQASESIAGAVREFCSTRLASASDGEARWLVSTIAEASLVLGDLPEAERRYREAAVMGKDDLGDLAAMRRNARIILSRLPAETGAGIEQAIRMPSVAVFSGHRVDNPGRTPMRLPQEVTDQVRSALRTKLIERNVRIGYASAASGADILFVEALKEIGGRAHIVLPCGEEQFISDSVATPDGAWIDRYRSVLASADEVLIASDGRLALGSIAYEYANDLLHGLATARAGQLDTEVVRIAVWDGRPAQFRGGTAEVVEAWRSSGHEVEIVNPLDFLPPQSDPAPAADSAAPATDAVIRAMIFADAFHFSKLNEEQVPAFVSDFIGPIAAELQETSPAPLFQNTWGDGLFFVFERARDAGRFALKLAERMKQIDRAAAGLPETISLRIALHVGPVYQFEDRIVGKRNFIGSHVNRTARIEPVTPPGQVYGTYAFTAMAALEAPGEFRCDYVGRIPLAKGFGEFPMYRVTQA